MYPFYEDITIDAFRNLVLQSRLRPMSLRIGNHLPLSPATNEDSTDPEADCEPNSHGQS